jgi:hypothetical protein
VKRQLISAEWQEGVAEWKSQEWNAWIQQFSDPVGKW